MKSTIQLLGYPHNYGNPGLVNSAVLWLGGTHSVSYDHYLHIIHFPIWRFPWSWWIPKMENPMKILWINGWWLGVPPSSETETSTTRPRSKKVPTEAKAPGGRHPCPVSIPPWLQCPMQRWWHRTNLQLAPWSQQCRCRCWAENPGENPENPMGKSSRKTMVWLIGLELLPSNLGSWGSAGDDLWLMVNCHEMDEEIWWG